MLNYTYLSTPQELESFNHNDSANYQYVALFDFGLGKNDLSKHEFNMIRDSLARFMKKQCLIVRNDELEQASEDSYIKSIFQFFEKPEEIASAYIAIATMEEDVLDRILRKPVYHAIEWSTETSSRYPCLDAVNACLNILRTELYITSLNDYPIPDLESTQLSLRCPNGPEIKKRQERIGSFNMVTNPHIPNLKGRSQVKFKESSLKKAKKSEPMKEETLLEIAEKLKVPLDKIIFKRLVPLPDKCTNYRIKTGLDKNTLALKFDLKSGLFFDLFEGAEVLPPKAAIYVYYQYRTHFFPSLKFSDLIDTEASYKLG